MPIFLEQEYYENDADFFEQRCLAEDHSRDEAEALLEEEGYMEADRIAGDFKGE